MDLPAAPSTVCGQSQHIDEASKRGQRELV
jgi:hypothetical protein